MSIIFDLVELACRLVISGHKKGFPWKAFRRNLAGEF
jgi:hypothetical protein